MNKTKIDWADMSWNPVTGCRHGCAYCYASRTAHRFDARLEDRAPRADGLHVLDTKIKAAPYPFGFAPTLHRYRLNQPEHIAEPQTVFVCSMADLFGRWVPTSWIVEVLDACKRAPWHRYTPEDVCREYQYTAPVSWVSDAALNAFCEVFVYGETFTDIGNATVFYNPQIAGHSEYHEGQIYVCSIGDVKYFEEM